MKDGLLIVLIISLPLVALAAVANSFHFENVVTTSIQTQPGLGEKNQADANKSNAEALQIQDEVRRQREMDDELAINVWARIITGRGLTDAEQLFSSFGQCLLGGIFLIVCIIILLKARVKRS